MRKDWSTEIVDCLAGLKRDGLDFDAAWANAVLLHPPRGRDLGAWRPTLLPAPGDEESVVEFMRRACDDAWHGRRRALRHFTVSAMRDAVIDAAESGRAGASRTSIGVQKAVAA